MDTGVQQSVLANVDDVLIGRGRLIRAGLFDVQQMEVLKGPQALFYGKNSPAGAVSITSADLTDQCYGTNTGYTIATDARRS